MKKLVVLIFGIVTIVAFSCKKGNPSQTNLNIVVKSDLSKSVALGSTIITGTNGPGVIKGATLTASFITLETFLINIEDIEFEMDDDIDDIDDNDDYEDNDGDDDGDDDKGIADDDDDGDSDEFEIKGPILIDLLSDEVGNGLVVATSDLPNGVYEEAEVELDRYKKDPANKMYNHTMLIEGQIDGKPMEMWYNGDYDIEIDFPDSGQSLALSGDDINVYIDFHINKMLETLNSIDFSGAKDGNNNGIIEIGSDNVDGNHDFAHYFIGAIFKSFDLDDDCDDDENDDDKD